MWNWLYNDQDIHPLNMPATLVMVNAPFTEAPHINLLLQNQKNYSESLNKFCASTYPPVSYRC